MRYAFAVGWIVCISLLIVATQYDVPEVYEMSLAVAGCIFGCSAIFMPKSDR